MLLFFFLFRSMILGLELETVEDKISVGSNVPIIIHTVDYMSYPYDRWVRLSKRPLLS